MTTLNPFDLLGYNDADDPLLLIAAQPQKIEPNPAKGPSSQNKPTAQPRVASKHLAPSETVREAKSESTRGGRGGGGGGIGYGRGRSAGGRSFRDSTDNENSNGNREMSAGQGAPVELDSGKPYERRGGYGGPRGSFRGGSYKDSSNNENSYGNREISAGPGAPDESDSGKPYERRGGYGGPRGSFRGDRRGGSGNGEGESDFPRRTFERRSGTGRGNEFKREGAGRGNWGSQADELAHVTEEVVNEGDKNLDVEKPSGEDAAAADGDKEVVANEVDEKESEDKEMTLAEYEKLLEEKRKALLALKTEERKVDTKEFESMQPLSNKKSNDDIFIKLGSEKDKKKDLAEKEERAKKSLSINEFLKPAEGEKFYPRGRGRGSRGGFRGGSETNNARAPEIKDQMQFPTLGGK